MSKKILETLAILIACKFNLLVRKSRTETSWKVSVSLWYHFSFPCEIVWFFRNKFVADMLL